MKKQADIRLYTKKACQYCEYAKELLQRRGIEFQEVDVGDDYVLRGWLAWATGTRTLPQLFLDGEPLGGFSDMTAMDATGELLRRVKKTG